MSNAAARKEKGRQLLPHGKSRIRSDLYCCALQLAGNGTGFSWPGARLRVRRVASSDWSHVSSMFVFYFRGGVLKCAQVVANLEQEGHASPYLADPNERS